MSSKKQTYILVPNYYDFGGDIVAGKGLGKFGETLNKFEGFTNAAGNFVGGLANKTISGGLTSDAGNVITGLSNVASTIPGPWGAIAGVGLNLAGGLVNKVFGSKLNKANINNIESGINSMKGFTSDANSFDALENSMTSAPTGIGFTQSTVGKDGLLSNKAKRKYNQLKAEAQAANEWVDNSFMNNISNIKNSQNAMLMANYSAFGGPIDLGYIPIGGAIDYEIAQRKLEQGDLEAQTKGITKQAYIPPIYALGGNLRTNGMDWTNGITLIDSGGTHEQNPLQGVPMGIDNQGKPNLVEEGEVIWNNYVFSNRIPIPDELAKALKIQGKNMTFADAAKKAQKESEERPNDPISKRGLQASMARLQAAQEALKQQLAGLQGDNNGQEYAEGGDLLKRLKSIDLSAFPLYADYVHPKGSTAYGFMNRPPNIPAKNGGEFAYYNDGKYDQGYLDFVNSVNDDDAKVIADYIKDYTGRVLTPAQLRANAIDIGKEGGGYGVAHQILGQLYSNKVNAPILDRNPWTGTRGTYEWGFGKGLDNFWQAQSKAYDANKKESIEAIANGASPWEALTHYDTTYVGFQGDDDIPYTIPKEEEEIKSTLKDLNKDSPLAYLRYAPAIGAGLGVFSDLMGWTNKPNYTNADFALNSSNSLKDVHYNPIGDYMRYTPLDREFYINQLNAQAGSTRRAIINNSGGNRGQAIAGILAADYGAQNQLGQLARQAEEYNLGQRERVASFNRGTNMFNSENDLKAQIANNSNREVQMRAALTAAQLRDAADARASAGRSTNLTNLFDNLGNIGIDIINRQDRDRLIRAGVFGTLSQRPYGWSDKRWQAYQDAVQGIGFDDGKKANGGKIKTKKKKGLTI